MTKHAPLFFQHSEIKFGRRIRHTCKLDNSPHLPLRGRVVDYHVIIPERVHTIFTPALSSVPSVDVELSYASPLPSLSSLFLFSLFRQDMQNLPPLSLAHWGLSLSVRYGQSITQWGTANPLNQEVSKVNWLHKSMLIAWECVSVSQCDM